MLCPEVWNFKPPALSFTEINSTDSLYNKVVTEIKNHYFNHSVTVILPDTVLVPNDLNKDLTEDSVYYKVESLSISTFLESQFIDSFVRKGELSGLSIGTHIDTDNCACFTPSGHLVLNILRDTFQTLGLEGTQSRFSTERYVVQIDLKHPSFVPGKKNYERTVKGLTEFVDLKMDFLLAWEPPEDLQLEPQQICPSSVAAYFAMRGYVVSSCSPQVTTSRQYNVPLPPDDTPQHEILEWLGAIALGVNLRRETDEDCYLSSYSGPLETTHETQAAVLKHLGFFSTAQIEKLFKTFSTYVEKRNNLKWAALHVNGFSDSPVSWLLHEHTYHTNGDNNYTILLRPDKSMSMFKICSFHKKMKFKHN